MIFGVWLSPWLSSLDLEADRLTNGGLPLALTLLPPLLLLLVRDMNLYNEVRPLQI